MLNIVVSGAADAQPPLLIAHGLFGSARNWGVIARRLSAERQVIAVDMRNHADSPRARPHDYPAMAADLAEVIAANGGRADVLGHSMGGKAAMVLALTRPDLVRRLIVADIAPTSYNHTQQHLIDAMRGLDVGGLTSRIEADRRLAADVPEAPVRAFLLQSLDLKAEPPVWRFDLDALEDGMEDVLSFPNHFAGPGRFEGPVLFLSGAESGYVRASHHARILELFPNARFHAIEGAGHWLHADRPREFEAEIAAFLG